MKADAAKALDSAHNDKYSEKIAMTA